jgi:hypothetical protein
MWVQAYMFIWKIRVRVHFQVTALGRWQSSKQFQEQGHLKNRVTYGRVNCRESKNGVSVTRMFQMPASCAVVERPIDRREV